VLLPPAAAPVELFFEDFAPGQVHALGSVTVVEDEIVDFARRFDPQPFHVDPAAAGATPFGGLIASGWWTAAAWMRLYVDTLLHRAASLGSPGVEELRWRRPVRPGDTLTGSLTVLATAPSERDPRRGTVVFECAMTAADGVAVMTMRGRGLFRRREPQG